MSKNIYNLAPGQMVAGDNLAPRVFIEMCKGESDPGAEFVFWTFPEGRNPEVKYKHVWVMRADGVPGIDIDLNRRQTLERYGHNFPGVREFYVDGREILMKGIPDALASKRPRTTVHGWELMDIGDSKLVCMDRFWLNNALTLCLMTRRLEWRFHAERALVIERHLTEKRPYWTVTRKR